MHRTIGYRNGCTINSVTAKRLKLDGAFIEVSDLEMIRRRKVKKFRNTAMDIGTFSWKYFVKEFEVGTYYIDQYFEKWGDQDTLAEIASFIKGHRPNSRLLITSHKTAFIPFRKFKLPDNVDITYSVEAKTRYVFGIFKVKLTEKNIVKMWKTLNRKYGDKFNFVWMPVEYGNDVQTIANMFAHASALNLKSVWLDFANANINYKLAWSNLYKFLMIADNVKWSRKWTKI